MTFSQVYSIASAASFKFHSLQEVILSSLSLYSHLSNKRGVTLIDFEKKFHPPRTFPPSTFIDFLDFFHPPLHVYCIYILVFFQKIPPSTFIPTSTFSDFATFAPPPRLFQSPCLLERWDYVSHKFFFELPPCR